MEAMDLEAYLQDDDGITDAGFDTDYPVTEYDTDTPDKKVLIKRRARNRYKEILGEFKRMERSVKDSADEGALSSGSSGDDDYQILVPNKKQKKVGGTLKIDSASDTSSAEQTEREETEDMSMDPSVRAFQARLKIKAEAQQERREKAQLKIDALSPDESGSEAEGFGDKSETFNLDDEVTNLNSWIDAQKRLKGAIDAQNPNQTDEASQEKNPRKRRRAELSDENDEESEEEPLVQNGDMDAEERDDPYFAGVHDETYDMKSKEPPTKKVKRSKNRMADDELTEKQKEAQSVAARAELEMMMATDDIHGAYDPEDAQMEPDELAKKLDKRLKRNWRLRWLIKKAVKRKLAERDEFEFDEKDERFGALTEDPAFAMDPADKSYRESKVMKKLLKTTRKKRAQKWSEKNRGRLLSGKKGRKGRKGRIGGGEVMDADQLIESVKAKSAAIPKIIDAQQQRKKLTQKLKVKGLSSFDS